MKNTTQVLHIRKKRISHQERSPLGRLGLASSALVGIFLLLVIFAALAAYTNLTRDLPSLQALPDLLNPSNGSLLQPTRLYDRTGTHLILALEDSGAAGHEYLTLEYLPQTLVNGYLAVFEPAFWESPGYTLQGVWESEDTSSFERPIAQRLVSELLLWDEPASLRRNLRERLLAAQLIVRYGRAQVLEWSLNTAHFGPLIYGADAAARTFFGKSATELNLGEAAFLLAAAQSPQTNPLVVSQGVLQRQKSVLQTLLLSGAVNATDAALASQAEYVFRDPIPASNLAPAFTSLVLEQISAYYPLERIQRGGLRVITTLDYDLQIQTLCTTATLLDRLKGAQEVEITIEGQACEAARLLPTIVREDQTALDGLAANAVILDPASGQVLAMVGELAPGPDLAQGVGHPGGSLLTPFIYLTQFTRGFGPASLVWDLPPGDKAATQGDSEQNLADYHGPVRMRIALANDYLEPAGQIIRQLGSETILRLTHELGLESLTSLSSDGPAGLDQPIVLLDVAHAYSIFANQGTLAGLSTLPAEGNPPASNAQQSLEPVAVLSLEDMHGGAWLDRSTSQKNAILAPQLAYMMADVLSDETARWPSLGHPNPLEIGRPAGAKLGLSSDGSSAWSIGFTPLRLVGVWLGFPQANGERVTPDMPAALWHALMQYASRDLPSQDWKMPAGVSSIPVCDPSGLLPTNICPNIVNEIFLSGSEPIHQDNLYRSFQINRETGQLATIFTPPEMVEEQTFLILPAEAIEWARRNDIPISPDSYDAIYVSASHTPDVRIDSPLMFGHVSGNLIITGSASGEDFAFYRLQAGQGLNPQSWLTISEDINDPVEEGILGEWQTQGLNGLYILQLLVVRQDQSVEKSVLQVTVDNVPPQLTLVYPAQDQKIKVTTGLKVLLQAEASDDLELARLEFYVDDQLIATLTEAPFNILWQGQSGRHTLLVKAYDLAGNVVQTSSDFELVR